MRSRALLGALLAALAAAGAAQAQPAPPPSSAPAAAPAASDWRALEPENTLVLETTKGRVIIEMRPEIAPLAVARIKALARRGYYDGAQFYRVIKGYMAQGGDRGARTFRSELPNLRAEFMLQRAPDAPFVPVGDIPNGQVGFIGSMPMQLQTAPAEAWAQYCPGVAAMPHYTDPNTANSQMFIMRAAAPQLDKTFTVWGRVVVGLDVIKALNNGEPPPDPDRMTHVRVLADVPAAQRPQIQVIDPAGPAFKALVQKGLQEKGAGFSLCDLDIPVRGQ